MTGPIRVVVADDQAIVREGLVTVLSLLPDVDVVGEAVDGDEACALADAWHPDVVLMDLRMPVLDGTAATARIVAAHPDIAVLVLTTYADDASVRGALRAGARGYLTKDADREDVAAAVRAVAHGHTTLGTRAGAVVLEGLAPAEGPAAPRPEPGPVAGSDPERAASAADTAGPAPDPAARLRGRFPTLTAREAQVLALIGEGLDNREIAADLFVSVATVKTHINAIFAKTGVRDRARAIALVRS